jgi:3-deoxy-D-manno-octulosonic-acid transferase|tara:strand:+ start:70942 stop:72252 length:1311 start_codon:yes stop_codon:yes gene_type:complete
MIWLYRLAYLPALLIALPYYGWRMWRRGGYSKDVAHRWGKLGNIPPRRSGVKRIWIQSVSVGEALALAPLLRALDADDGVEVFLTTTTSTGRKLIEERYADCTRWQGIFPLDFVLFSGRAWKRIQPDLVILMESELWPEHLQQAAKRKAPVVLINARMSQRSARRYAKMGAFSKTLLRPISQILAAGERDAKNFELLKLDCPIETVGNLKFDFDPSSSTLEADALASLLSEIGFTTEDLIIVGASTWPGEESALVEATKHLREAGLPVRLLLVPRHAERRAEITRELKAAKVPFHLRSEGATSAQDVVCYVADTTGELRSFIQLADIAFIGKSLPPHGDGQTPIEGAAFSKPLLFGSGMSNFQALANELLQSDAAIEVTAEDLPEVLNTLVRHEAERLERGQNARAVFERHRGAVGRILRQLETRLHACSTHNGQT